MLRAFHPSRPGTSREAAMPLNPADPVNGLWTFAEVPNGASTFPGGEKLPITGMPPRFTRRSPVSQGSGKVVDQQASVRQIASDVQLVARRVRGSW
jgi:hypothetical protein